jgi:hypothetical protein
VKRRYTVEELAWKDVPVGRIDLPGGRLDMVMGFGSGLARRAGDAEGTVWAIGDRGPNFKVDVAVERYGLAALARHAGASKAKVMPRIDVGPTLAEVRVTARRVRLIRTLPLTDGDGAALTGLPPPGSEQALVEPALDLRGNVIAPDPSGADTEGVVALPDGGFIVGDEYGPSLLRLDRQARVIERWVPEGSAAAFEGARYPVRDILPAIAGRRRLNRGFEALALSPDASELALMFQSPLANPGEGAALRARHVRLWTIELASGAVTAEHLYRLDKPKAFRRDPDARREDVKLSEIVWLAGGSLLVLERVSRSTKVYRVALDGGARAPDLSIAPTLEERSAADEPLPALAKTLVLDTDDAPEIGSDLEGMAVLGVRELLLANDNDFGVEGARTGFWRVRFDEPVFG